MRNKLSYYSVILLLGLAAVSGLIFVINPFNGAPASAAPGAQNSTHTVVTSTSTTSTAIPGVGASPLQIGNGFGDDSQSGGTFGGEHHHHSDFPGLGGATGNATTTTTTTSAIYSQDA